MKKNNRDNNNNIKRGKNENDSIESKIKLDGVYPDKFVDSEQTELAASQQDDSEEYPVNILPNDALIDDRYSYEFVRENDKLNDFLRRLDDNLENSVYIDRDDSDRIVLRNSVHVQTKMFNSTSLLIKDDFQTITEDDKKLIKLGLVSTRTYESVLGSKKDIRHGAAAINFINLFDKVLIRSIAENSTRLGIALSNKVFIRKLAYKVLDEVIRESTQNRNRGYVRRSFQITRAHISKSVSKILSKAVGRSKNPMRSDFIEGLSGIIEICMVAQLVNYYLFEVDDLNEKILTSVRDNICAVNDYQSFKHVIMTSNTRISIKRILGSTTKLSKSVNNDDKVNSVDNSLIVDSFMREIDLISEVLINNDITMREIDECMILMRLVRDKDILMLNDDFKIIVQEADNLYKSNKDLFDLFLTNYDVNIFLDEIEVGSVEEFSKEYGGQINSLSFKFINSMSNMKTALTFEDSYIRIQDKEEFLREFSIRNVKNDRGRVYHSFVRRNFENASNNQIFDALAQRARVSRNLLNTIPTNEESIVVLNSAKGNGVQFGELLEELNRIGVLSSELAYFESIDSCVPEYMNAVMYQTALLKRGDIKKIAAFNSDQVLVSYLDYCEDFIRRIQTKIDLDVDSIRERRVSTSPIYIKLCNINNVHKDSSLNSIGNCTIITREPRRIISTIDNYYGDRNISIISNMVEKGRYVVGRTYASEALRDDFILWPNNRSFDVNVYLPHRLRTIDGFSAHIDFQKIFNPFSFNSISIGSTNTYHSFCDEFTRILSFFRFQNLALLSNMNINFSQLRRGFDVPDYRIVEDQQHKNDNFVTNGSNSASLQQCFLSSLDAYRKAKKTLIAYENGSVVHYKDKDSVSFSIRVPEEEYIDNSQNIAHMFSRILKIRMETDQTTTHQYIYVNLINELYGKNKFFAQIVDNTLQYNGDFDGSNQLYASKLMEIYAYETSDENPSLFRMLSSIILASCFKNLAKKGGDLAFIFKSKNADDILTRLIMNKTDVDSSLFVESELVFLRRNVRLSDFISKSHRMIKPFYEQSFFISNSSSQEYKTEILSTVMENKNLDVVEKISNMLETADGQEQA